MVSASFSWFFFTGGKELKGFHCTDNSFTVLMSTDLWVFGIAGTAGTALEMKNTDSLAPRISLTKCLGYRTNLLHVCANRDPRLNNHEVRVRVGYPRSLQVGMLHF